MDRDATLARSAKYGRPKFRLTMLLIHVGVVAVVVLLIIKLPHGPSAAFSRWLTIVATAAMFIVAGATFRQLRRAAEARRMIALMGTQQLCFAISMLAAFIRSETTMLAVTCSALTLGLLLLILVRREQRAFTALMQARTRETVRAIEGAKSGI